MGQQETHVVTQNKFCATTCSGATAPNPGTRRARRVSRRRASDPCRHGPATPAGGPGPPLAAARSLRSSIFKTMWSMVARAAWRWRLLPISNAMPDAAHPSRSPGLRPGRRPRLRRGGHRTKLHPSFRHCKKQNLRANSKLQLPGSFRRFCLLIIPPTPAPIPGHSS